MYRRLIILTVIIAAALGGLTVLGYHAIERWAEGLKWKQFAEVAEQIRQDVEHKLDDFIQREEERFYTEYQYYYVPDNITNTMQQMAVMRSPLGGRLEHGLAYNHFQIEPDGSILTPNDDIVQRDGANPYNWDIDAKNELNRRNVKYNLLPALNLAAPGSAPKDLDEKVASGLGSLAEKAQTFEDDEPAEIESQKKKAGKIMAFQRQVGMNYPIDSLQRQQRGAQVVEQQRSIMMGNIAAGDLPTQQELPVQVAQAEDLLKAEGEITDQEQAKRETLADVKAPESRLGNGVLEAKSTDQVSQGIIRSRSGPASDSNELQIIVQKQMLRTRAPQKADATDAYEEATVQAKAYASESAYESEEDLRSKAINLDLDAQKSQTEIVQVRIEPFEPVVVGGGDAEKSVFGKQVFLVRDVQIEDRRFRQGFQLNENRLIEVVKKSAAGFMRKGMTFELPQTKSERADTDDVAYSAVLDFGFGYLILHLKETFPEVIAKQASQLHKWYFSIVTVVFIAVMLALASLWRYARAQIKLAEKKDDFISAVSHELRTPLTSIRMYSEMLENKWVKSEEKVAEYYRSMRQESERLSRLIENVLDFSRIQKGRKKYTLSVGDLNNCIAGVVEMMTPYAVQNGFKIRMELEPLGQTAFDNDAIKQIVVNLLDNAVKYARNAKDKTVTVRTRSDSQYVLIEVEDHGPGVPHRQRKKIFEEFYRLGSEATRETNGTGLGLALVKKFAQAHNGFVEILTAKPAGSIFRVGLAMQS